MANEEHLAILRQGVEAWNLWRQENSDAKPDLSMEDLRETDFRKADLHKANLRRVDLRKADLREADLSEARLQKADLSGADLSNANLQKALFAEYTNLVKANLSGADLRQAFLGETNLRGADLRKADLSEAYLRRADLCDTDLRRASLWQANLWQARLCRADLRRARFRRAYLAEADLSGADLSEADLREAYLGQANLRTAVLRGADLRGAQLVHTLLEEADLTGCKVFGVSAWRVRIGNATQANLVITDEGEAEITVDNLEIAQFIYLLLNNERIREVINTITSKVVLILGRFTPERKIVLDAIRDELRRRDYLPIVFDFDKPASRDLTETISTLAHMARFVIADITDAKSIPQELQAIVPSLPSVPVQPLLLASQHEYGMFEHFRRFPWVLEPYLYDDQDGLLRSLAEKVIAPAELKAKEQTGR